MRTTSSQAEAALMEYLGVPLKCFIANNKTFYQYPATQETCAGQVDLDTVLKHFHEGEQEVSDAKALIGAVFRVIQYTYSARSKARVPARVMK
jgi:hypothetical protein